VEHQKDEFAADGGLAVWLASIGDRIRRARQQRGTSRERLARDTGVSVELLTAVEEKTLHSIDVSQLWRVADALWVSVTDLITTTSESPLDRGP
jgi:XRE family transcriptional regulator, aerobic/anaerobic benzoate catabolism transcriptional regulator